MIKNALIVYSTWTGSTREVGEYIANILNKRDVRTKVISAKDKVDLESYDLFIIGTSIHASLTISSFRSFLKSNQAILSENKVALFVSCANMMNDTEETRIETLGWLNKAIKPFQSIVPVSIGLFGGATITSGGTFDQLNIFARRIVSVMQKNMISEYGKSDFRDWEKIESWTIELINKFQ